METKLYKTLINYKYYILILVSIVLYIYYFKLSYEGFQVKPINKTIFVFNMFLKQKIINMGTRKNKKVF